MQAIHPLQHHKTSVSLPTSAYRLMRAGRTTFFRNGIRYSEQEMYRQLFKYFLKNWRGRGSSKGPRRYNAGGKSYEIHHYINEVLYSALWQRAIHSGESISRMLQCGDPYLFARILEELLRSPQLRNSHYWATRYNRRPNQYPDFFINYQCRTANNNQYGLDYRQTIQIISKADCSAMQIWHLVHSAA